MIADMAYIDGDDKITAMKKYGTAVCTEVCNEKGRIVCQKII